MCMTQNPRFSRLRNQMSNFRKKIERKNNFPKRLCFPSAMSCFRYSKKMRFPEIPEKMVELHNCIKSSEMVIRGRYMTHFDRRDLLKSKKLVWDRFHNIFALPGPIREFSRFFRKFRRILQVVKIRFF